MPYTKIKAELDSLQKIERENDEAPKAKMMVFLPLSVSEYVILAPE